MKHTENRVSDIQIAYIGGGSRGWAWGLMSDLAVEPSLSGTIKLYDIDHEAAYKNQVIGNKLTAKETSVGKWTYEAVDSLKEALTGADFVIISILPGTLEEMKSDVHTPETYGIYQSVGDTVGPGGFVRALRTIPMFEEIGSAIKNYSPKAWVINYTNPMTICVRTLYETFPDIKAFGCCHEVFGTQKLLIEMLGEEKGIKNIKREDIKVNVLGINHFTWLTKATYKDLNLMPIYKEFVSKYHKTGYLKAQDDNWLNNYFTSGNRVKFDLFDKYSSIAAAGDRHLAEFMPPWYLVSPETANDWHFTLTPVSWRIKNRQELIEKSNRLYEGQEEMELKETGEDGVKQIKALLGLSDLITNVNLPNTGQIPNLPLGAVVETNALFTAGQLHPVQAGPLPSNILPLINRHVANQENLIKAYREKDRQGLINTFRNDPLINLSPKDSLSLFETMTDNTKSYLPDWILK